MAACAPTYGGVRLVNRHTLGLFRKLVCKPGESDTVWHASLAWMQPETPASEQDTQVETAVPQTRSRKEPPARRDSASTVGPPPRRYE